MAIVYMRCRRRAQRGLDESGATLPEMIVTLGIVSVVVGTSVLSLNRTFTDLGTASQGFMNDLRQARQNAVTRGAHYQVSWTTNAYTTQRLQDNDHDGVWHTDSQATPQTANLPTGVSMATTFPTGTSPQAVEFDTRGMVVPQPSATPGVIRVGITKTQRPAGSVRVEIWPSGQVNPAS